MFKPIHSFVTRATSQQSISSNLFYQRFQYSTSVSSMSCEELVKDMKKHGVRRGYVVYDNGQFKVSSPAMEPIRQFLEQDKRDFLQHEGLFFEIGPKSDTLFGAFVHKTKRGQAQGGVRLWNYQSVEAFLRDGLRLSLGMSRKNALAGLWWGGGKGLIQKNPSFDFTNLKNREIVFQEYGSFVTGLRGCYYGAEDVGLTVADTKLMFEKSRFITCIPSEIGGSGNPSHSTARGVVCAMEGVLDFKNKGDTLEGKTVAMQGAGNVARFMIQELLNKGVRKIKVTDIAKESIQTAQHQFASYGDRVELHLVTPDDNSILFEKCDILAPNALGGILNSETIPKLQTKIVCGAANNQLLDPSHDELLMKQGITYVPDYLCNRMGIVNCANENYGYVKVDPLIVKHFGREWENAVFVICQKVLQQSKELNIPTGKASNKLADEYCQQLHPIMGHRSMDIIRDLISDKWDQKAL